MRGRSGPCLLAAALVLALFSTGTPDVLGLAELAIGALLVAAVGPWRALQRLVSGRSAAARSPDAEPELPLSVRFGALYLLLVPTLIGIGGGWQPTDIVRDVVPLLFLLLPCLLAPTAEQATRLSWVPLACLLAIGAGFALRYLLWIAGGASFEAAVDGVPSIDERAYLPNSPAVLFAALFGFGLIMRPGRGAASPLLVVLGAVLCGVCLASIAATVQRAALGLAAAAIATMLLLRLAEAPRAGLLALAVMVAAVLAYPDPLLATWDAVVAKTALHGWNAHLREITDALAHAGRSMPAALFGAGWGALIDSPAVPGLPVSFVHAFPIYLLVKTGLLGVVAMAVVLWPVVRAAAIVAWRHPMAAAWVAPPLAVGVLVLPTFKTLSFGLLLLFIVVEAARIQSANASVPHRVLRTPGLVP